MRVSFAKSERDKMKRLRTSLLREPGAGSRGRVINKTGFMREFVMPAGHRAVPVGAP